MALCQLLNRACNSPDVVFRTLRDFLAAVDGIDDFTPAGDNPGPGYEIVDASYASGNPADTTTGDWCVLRSYGEAHSYPVYIQIVFGASQHSINPYLHWDTEAHTGSMGTTRWNNVNHNGAGDVLLYVYADLDEIHIVIKPRASNVWWWHPCGRIKSDQTFYNGVALQAAQPIATDTDVTISLPSWPEWAKVGRKIYNWDTVSIHELTISAVDEVSRTITVETAYSKAAGSWLVEDMLIFTNSAYNSKATEGRYAIPGRNTAAPATQFSFGTAITPLPGWDVKYGIRLTSDIWMTGTNIVCGRLALVRQSRYAITNQGEPWTDDAGVSWRLHNVSDNVVLAFREAI